mgnify:FL=1
MKKKLVSIVLIIVLLQCFCIFAFAENETESNVISNEITDNITNELNEQKQQVDEKLEQTNTKLEYVQEELTDSLLRVQEIEDKVLSYEKEVNDLGAQMNDLQTSIDREAYNLMLASQDYEKLKQILLNRLVTIYETGNTTYLDVLLQSKDLTDFISRYYVIEEITEYDNTLINQVKNQKESLEQTTQKLENEQAELKIVKARKEQTTVVLNNMKTMQESYITKLSDGEKKLQKEITAYKKEQAEIEAKIMEITNTILPNIQYTGGEMLWPVAASGTVITSQFGIREHPIQGVVKQHTGLDIGGAPTGTPVVAAADGVVSYAGWLGGYGNCVMVNHGNGIVTLYGHGSKVVASLNQEVKKGDTILEIGSTGNSTGPHLHFEVRINGQYVNPLNYVKVPQ